LVHHQQKSQQAKQQRSSSDMELRIQPKLKQAVGSIVVPGDPIGRLVVAAGAASTGAAGKVRLVPGPGTYVWRNSDIHASTIGTLTVEPLENSKTSEESSSGGHDELPSVRVSVVSSSNYYGNGSRTTNNNKKVAAVASDQVIRRDQIVLARVMRLTNQQVVVEILANEASGSLLRYPPEGIIRREDIHAGVQTELVDSASVLTQAFRPGDIIVAKVLSLGDARRYFLSTAEPSLGVIYATSSSSSGSSSALIPVSWKEMEDMQTGKKEARKSARPPKIPDQLKEQLLGSNEMDVS
jgi:exosome complex RNA-binding protein Csl4